MDKPRILVSSMGFDIGFAAKFADDLCDAGADAWADQFNQASISLASRLKLAKCKWSVLVLSRQLLGATRAHREIDSAIRLRDEGDLKDLICIVKDDLDIKLLPRRWKLGTVYNAATNYSSALSSTLKEVGLPEFDLPAEGLVLSSIADEPEDAHPSHPPREVFISYRRDDTASGHAGRLSADLTRRYGKDKVFMDLSIEPGTDFVTTLEETVSSCKVLLVVIGRNWLTVVDAKTGKRRLDNAMDWVRVEIATALKRDIRVIPVLFHGAHMPTADGLPDDLKPLARRQALEITDTRWDYDVDNLLTVLDKIVGHTN